MTEGGDNRHQCVWSGNGLCSHGTVEDGQRVAAKTERPDWLCFGCEKLLERSVSELAEMWVTLHASVGEKGMRRSDKVSGTRVLQVPLNLDIDSLKAEIVEWLVAAAARVAEVLNTDDPAPRLRRSHVHGGEEHSDTATTAADAEHAEVVDRCVRLLKPNLDKLIAAETDAVMVWRRRRIVDESGEWYQDYPTPEDMSGVEIASRLVRAHKTARRILGQTTPRFRMALPCDTCQAPTLYRIVEKTAHTQRDDVFCDTCRRCVTYDAYQASLGLFRRVKESEVEQWLAAELLWKENLSWRWRVAELEWKFSLAASCTDVSAADFIEALGEAA